MIKFDLDAGLLLNNPFGGGETGTSLLRLDTIGGPYNENGAVDVRGGVRWFT